MKVLFINGNPNEEGNTYSTLGHNLARMIKALKDVPRPHAEEHAWTHFIR